MQLISVFLSLLPFKEISSSHSLPCLCACARIFLLILLFFCISSNQFRWIVCLWFSPIRPYPFISNGIGKTRFIFHVDNGACVCVRWPFHLSNIIVLNIKRFRFVMIWPNCCRLHRSHSISRSLSLSARIKSAFIFWQKRFNHFSFAEKVFDTQTKARVQCELQYKSIEKRKKKSSQTKCRTEFNMKNVK